MKHMKIRVWDKQYKRYEYIDDLYWFEENGIHSFNDERYVFELSIGLYDRDDVEIYKGDIVRYWKPDVYDVDDAILDETNCYPTTHLGRNLRKVTSNAWLIGWNKMYARWQVGLEGAKNSMGEDVYEVIGNIHTNPELLEPQCSS